MLPFKLHSVHVVTLSGWVSKVIVAGSQIVLMRLMLNVLGVEGYSSYVVIFSLYSWFSLMDFGIGYSYQNHISRCRVEGTGRGDEGKFFTLSMIVLVGNLFLLPISITIVSILLYGHFSWEVMVVLSCWDVLKRVWLVKQREGWGRRGRPQRSKLWHGSVIWRRGKETTRATTNTTLYLSCRRYEVLPPHR